MHCHYVDIHWYCAVRMDIIMYIQYMHYLQSKFCLHLHFSFIHCLFSLMCFVVVIMLQPGNTSPEAVCPASALCSILF